MLKVFDGDDAAKRNQFRLVAIPRIWRNDKNEEVVVRCCSLIRFHLNAGHLKRVYSNYIEKLYELKPRFIVILNSTSCTDRKQHSEPCTSQTSRRITSFRVTANRDCLQMTSSTATAHPTTKPCLRTVHPNPGFSEPNPEKRRC